MKRALMIALAVIVSLAFAGAGIAADAAKSTTDTSKSTPDTSKGPTEGAKSTTDMSPMKAKVKTMTGEVTNVDMSAKTIAVKGKKGEETFDVSNVKNADSVKMGERVTVSYSEQEGKMVAKSVKMAGGKKTAKEEKKEKTG